MVLRIRAPQPTGECREDSRELFTKRVNRDSSLFLIIVAAARNPSVPGRLCWGGGHSANGADND
jgi:hypothetical protein